MTAWHNECLNLLIKTYLLSVIAYLLIFVRHEYIVVVIFCCQVPSFLALCSDSTWIVRKACAVVFTSVSSAASTCTRKQHLAPAFAALLTDPLHYVRSAAFQSLGPFITTFAEPSITNLGYNHQGKLVLRHPDGFEFL